MGADLANEASGPAHPPHARTRVNVVLLGHEGDGERISPMQRVVLPIPLMPVRV